MTAAIVATVLVAASAVSLGAVGSVPQEVGTARFKEGIGATFRMTGRVWDILQNLPPVGWDPNNENETHEDGWALAAAYLSRCTQPDARILNASYETDFLVFARRGFAAGRANFVPGYYASPVQQREAIERARRQVIPVAITNPQEIYEEDFVPEFPLVDEFLRQRYVEGGTISKDGEPFLRVLVQRDMQPTGTFENTDLPCFQ